MQKYKNMSYHRYKMKSQELAYLGNLRRSAGKWIYSPADYADFADNNIRSKIKKEDEIVSPSL